MDWNGGRNHVPHHLPLSQISGFALDCPDLSFDWLDIFILSDVKRKNYARFNLFIIEPDSVCLCTRQLHAEAKAELDDHDRQRAI